MHPAMMNAGISGLLLSVRFQAALNSPRFEKRGFRTVVALSLEIGLRNVVLPQRGNEQVQTVLPASTLRQALSLCGYFGIFQPFG